MSDMVDKISVVQKFLNILTWKKLVQLVAFILVIGIAWGTFENRKFFYSYLNNERWAQSPNANSKLSKESKEEIDNVVTKSDLIIGLQITIVDFNRNTRLIVHSSIDDENLKKIYNAYINNTIGADIPLFNSDPANNVRMSQLINGEFICNPFKETIAYRLAPDAAESVNMVCANGIPPYYGKFTGIITLYLKKPPTKEESDQLRSLSKSLAKEIFERDFH